MTGHPSIPDPGHRVELNCAQLATGADSGFWDDHGRPAPWPDDIDEWRPSKVAEAMGKAGCDA
jgi:hypothetical protein